MPDFHRLPAVSSRASRVTSRDDSKRLSVRQGRFVNVHALIAPLAVSGVRLVTSDAYAGLVAAIGAALPGAAW